MLNPLRYGLFAWQLASHKLCRWLVPFAMMAAAAANAVLAVESPCSRRSSLVSCVFYASAARRLLDRSPVAEAAGVPGGGEPRGPDRLDSNSLRGERFVALDTLRSDFDAATHQLAEPLAGLDTCRPEVKR